MAFTNSANRFARGSVRRSYGPQAAFAAASVIAFAGSAAATTMLAGDLVLPVITTLFFILAVTVALIALARGRAADERAVTYWDVAGALTFVGIFAAALVDPDQLVRLVGGARGGH